MRCESFNGSRPLDVAGIPMSLREGWVRGRFECRGELEMDKQTCLVCWVLCAPDWGCEVRFARGCKGAGFTVGFHSEWAYLGGMGMTPVTGERQGRLSSGMDG